MSPLFLISLKNSRLFSVQGMLKKIAKNCRPNPRFFYHSLFLSLSPVDATPIFRYSLDALHVNLVNKYTRRRWVILSSCSCSRDLLTSFSPFNVTPARSFYSHNNCPWLFTSFPLRKYSLLSLQNRCHGFCQFYTKRNISTKERKREREAGAEMIKYDSVQGARVYRSSSNTLGISQK